MGRSPVNLTFDRRGFLQWGAAMPLALQTLRLRGAERNSEPPKRVIFICNSLGFYQPYLQPKTQGDLSSSDYLNALAVPEKVTLIENLYHPGMETSNHDSEKSFLTGAQRPEALGFTNTVSVDQVLVEQMGGDTRFPFLSFSLYDRGWGCSWNRQGAAIPPQYREEEIFNQLFGPEDLTQRKRDLQRDQIILATLKEDLRSLTQSTDASVSASHYRNLITQLEEQVAHDRFWLETEKPKVDRTLSDDRKYEFSTKIHNLFELAKLAFRTDSTRLITFSMDWIYGAIDVPGASGGWHTLSHHGGRPEVLQDLRCVEVDILKHFNQFLVDLDAIEESGGTLLDHTTVVMGSCFGDASNHTCHQLPILVAGGGHAHQQHRVVDRGTPLCNLWLELLHHHHIDAGNFGSSRQDMNLLQR
jgi:hypothetical protein